MIGAETGRVIATIAGMQPAAAPSVATSGRHVVGVGVDTDLLYPAREVRQWTDAYRAAGVDAEYREIASIAGHDAFLIEWGQVGGALNGGKR